MKTNYLRANIGVVASQDSDNAKLTVQLAKDITGLNTVTAGTATIGNQTEKTASGVAQEGSYVPVWKYDVECS